MYAHMHGSRSLCLMGDFPLSSEACGAGRQGPLVTASVLLTDKSDNVLLVRSDHSWVIPSSAVAGDEAPHDCAERLASQQLGLTTVAGRLLVISWTPGSEEKSRAVVDFLFDGGAVYNESALPAGAGAPEVFRFFTWEQAESQVSAAVAKRLRPLREGREEEGAAYIPGVVEL
jgi:8-oxo-dGTP diphosphatase